jgi:hypothetical protein
MMKNIFLTIAVTILTLTAQAQTPGPISLAQAAELSAHRIDRLVLLGKIDAQFVNRLTMIEVSKVVNTPPTAYRSVVSQTAPATGLPLQVEITFDANGNALTYKTLPTGSSGTDPKWTGKNAGTLTENSLHYVLDNKAAPTIKPYFDNLKSTQLQAATLAGVDVAVVVMTSTAQAQKLNVFLNLDGTVNSVTITP